MLVDGILLVASMVEEDADGDVLAQHVVVVLTVSIAVTLGKEIVGDVVVVVAVFRKFNL